jgi:hypothetical protein
MQPVAAAEPDWSTFDEILQEFVVAGNKNGISLNLVNYEGLGKSEKFGTVVAQIRGYDTSQLQTRNEKLAFYINAYNILTIQLIIDHWPVKSIRDIGNLIVGPWDQVVMQGPEGDLTLDNIEHDIIRSFGEPLIHFAVNCASVSCPDLRREAFRAEQLQVQMADQLRLMLSQENKGASLNGTKLSVTSLFKWYADDFKASGGVEAFVRSWVPEISFTRLKANLPYDWDLNGQ